ncbi:hypothetical protein DL96DRAFT_1685546 [Flagelloscypha sp. PMI_526]|nr:hypothetical protein DL96DRAFT_1685546 [Flagelloscypha sp. PMI_526]
MSFSTRYLQDLTDKATDAAVECMCRGTEGDIYQLASAGWDPSLLPLSHLRNLKLAFVGGVIHVAERPNELDGTNSVCGVAVWYPPGRGSVLTPDVIAEIFTELASRLSPDEAKWWRDEFLNGYGALLRSSHGEDENHNNQWHLHTIVADKGQDRSEIIKALLQPLFDSRGDHVVCVEVEKRDNMSFYTDMGFKYAGEYSFSSVHGSFSLCAMTLKGE